MIAMAASRIAWYCRSVRVCAGATVIESPVWMPMGSRFSMEQMITTLSLRSRMISSSYSFQPITDSSMRISLILLHWSPYCACRAKSCSEYTMPPPVPPRVKLGLMMSGKPMLRAISHASSMLYASALFGRSMWMCCIAFLNSLRSSAFFIAS